MIAEKLKSQPKAAGLILRYGSLAHYIPSNTRKVGLNRP
jgi:hypothetical protein